MDDTKKLLWQKADALLFRMEQQHCRTESISGRCRAERCSNLARSNGLCSECCAHELGRLVGEDVAGAMLDSLRRTQRITRAIKGRIREGFA